MNPYTERAHLVAALSKLWPSSLERDPNEPDWPVCIIDSPAGQLSWHIAAEDYPLFLHLKHDQGRVWDGHTTQEKYDRLDSLPFPKPIVSHFRRVMGEMNPGLKPLIDAMEQDQEEHTRTAEAKRVDFWKEVEDRRSSYLRRNRR